MFLERACTITPFPRGIADVVGNATAQPPCDFDAPTPGLTVARKREDPGATDGPAGATDGGGGGGGGLSAGAAAGIAVGVALAVALAGLLGLLAYRRRRRLRAAPSVEAGKAAERGDSLSSLATGSKWLSDGRTGSRGVGGAGAGAGAGASSLAAAGLNKLSCGASEDALLSYLRSQAKSQASAVSLASRHSSARTSFTSARASGGVDVAPWVSAWGAEGCWGWAEACSHGVAARVPPPPPPPPRVRVAKLTRAGWTRVGGRWGACVLSTACSLCRTSAVPHPLRYRRRRS